MFYLHPKSLSQKGFFNLSIPRPLAAGVVDFCAHSSLILCKSFPVLTCAEKYFEGDHK